MCADVLFSIQKNWSDFFRMTQRVEKDNFWELKFKIFPARGNGPDTELLVVSESVTTDLLPRSALDVYKQTEFSRPKYARAVYSITNFHFSCARSRLEKSFPKLSFRENQCTGQSLHLLIEHQRQIKESRKVR